MIDLDFVVRYDSPEVIQMLFDALTPLTFIYQIAVIKESKIK